MGRKGGSGSRDPPSDELRLEAAWTSAPIGIGFLDRHGRWLRVNRALCELSGCSEQELLRGTVLGLLDLEVTGKGSSTLTAVLEHDAAEGGARQRRFTRANGEHGVALLALSPVAGGDGAAAEFVAHVEDVTELERLATQLADLAPPDALTGLAGRRSFIRDLARQLARADRHGETAALVVLGIDGFAALSERRGRAFGDRVLVAVGRALRARLRRSDVLARVGSAEFAVLLPGGDDRVRVAEALQELTAGLEFDDETPRVTATVGVTVVDRSAASAEVVLGELERLTLQQHQAGAQVGFPSRAATSLIGVRVLQLSRRRLGATAIAVAALAGAAVGIATIVSPPSHRPVLHISPRNVRVSTSGRFTVPLSCGNATCRGVLALTSTIPAIGRQRVARRVVVATLRFSVRAGHTNAAPGRLSVTGRRLFEAENRRLVVRAGTVLVSRLHSTATQRRILLLYATPSTTPLPPSVTTVTTAPVPAAPTGPTVPIGAVGINDISSDGILLPDASWDGPAELDRLAAAGVQLYRARVQLNCVDPAHSGSFDFNTPSASCYGLSYDALVGALAVRGITLLPVLINFNGSTVQPPTPDGAGASPTTGEFAAFAAAAAARYGPNGSYWPTCACVPHPIHAWEVWNEENNGYWWNGSASATQYAAVFAATRAALRSVDPQARVVVGGLTYDPNGQPSFVTPQQMIQALAAGNPNAFDAVAVHPYTDATGATADQLAGDALRVVDRTAASVTAATGGSRGTPPRQPVWITEMGWSNLDEPPPTIAAGLQAFFALVGQGARARDNIGPILWYDLRDNNTLSTLDDQLGLFYTASNGSNAGPKPVWAVFSAAASYAGTIALPPALGS